MSPLASQKGFVLAITLWTLAAVTVTAGFFALWTQSVLQRARQEQEDVQALIETTSTQATLLYLFAVQQITLAGLTVPLPPGAPPRLSIEDLVEKEGLDPLDAAGRTLRPAGGEIALDDTVYMGLGQTRFSIQDEAGLMAVNFVEPYQIENLLGLLEVPAPQRSPLVDRLLDYMDQDILVRLNGAEGPDYERAGLPPPPNRLLLTSWEARNALGWNGRPELWTAGRFARLTSATFGGFPNPNTAPALVLKTIPGVDDETARRIIDVRRQVPFSTPLNIDIAAGKFLNIDPFVLRLLPSQRERITLWREGGRRMKEVHLELTPRADQKAPWVIDYALVLPVTPEQENAHARPVPIPLFAAPLPADQN